LNFQREDGNQYPFNKLFSESRQLVRSGRSGSGEFLPERLAEARVVGKDGRARYSAGDMMAYPSEAFSRKRTANRGGTTGISPSSAESIRGGRVFYLPECAKSNYVKNGIANCLPAGV